ncbi:hypothetical protein D9M72_435000 [compost metagenome]
MQVQPGDDDRPVAVPELHPVEVDAAAGVTERYGVLRRPHGGNLLQQAGDLLKGCLGALERVVEHGHLVHRLEKALGGQDQGQQDTHGEVPVQHTETAKEQNHRDADVADQHQARLEDAVEVDGPDSHFAVVLGQFAVAVGVFALLAESLHCPDARHGLHEVHDQARGHHPGLAEGDLGVLLVPACQEIHGHACGQHNEAAAPVQGEHRDGREHHEQHPGGQRADARVQEFAQRFEVRRLAGDDPAGRVLLVEFKAQPLCVPEDADPQVQQHRLAQLRRRGHVQGGEACSGNRRGKVGDAGEDQRQVVPGPQCGQGVVDAEGDQRRPGHPGSLRQDHHGDGEPEPQPDGTDQGAQQRERPPSYGFAFALAQVGVVLVGGAEGSGGHREISSDSSLNSERSDSSESRSRGSVSRLAIT